MRWWQRLASILVQAGKHRLDDSQPVEVLLLFQKQRLQEFSTNKIASSPELAYGHHLSALLGVVSSGENITVPHPNLPSREQFDDWRQNLPNKRIIDRNGLIPQSGMMLLSILDKPNGDRAFLETELERLLRRVEVKRRTALESAGSGDRQNAWLEKHAIAILFSRAARTFQDLRFLNAALKLNDWAFSSHRRLRAGAHLERYVWSLAEQETSWKVLVR